MKKQIVSKLLVATLSASMLVTAVPVLADPVVDDASATEIEQPGDAGIGTVEDEEQIEEILQNSSSATSETANEVTDITPDVPVTPEVTLEAEEKPEEADTITVVDAEDQSPVTISYSANYDGNWMDISDGISGEKGTGSVLSGVQVELHKSAETDLHINYQVYSGEAWSEAVTEGTAVGNGPVQAVKFWLSGEAASKYQLKYRAYVQQLGSKEYTGSGAAGTIGFGLGLEGFELQLIPIDEENQLVGAGENSNAVLANPGVTYNVHQQTYGWLNGAKNGENAGVVGQSKRMEAFTANVIDPSLGVSLRYRTHVQKYGWMNWVSAGQIGGTIGQSKRMEAIQVELTGPNANKYDVLYCVHAQKLGWLNWAKNGEVSGTSGQALRLEAIAIKIVPKGVAASPSQGASVSYAQRPTLSYQTHVQKIGWQGLVGEGGISGTTGQSKRLEGIIINLDPGQYSGGISYRTHIQTYGWEGSYRSSGQMSGTSGQSKRLEAIQISLNGEIANYFDIYYRVHAQQFGWLGWAKNGQSAGTAGYSYRLECIQIQLVTKGGAAPGSTANAFVQPNTDRDATCDRYSSSTGWLIMTNKKEHRVNVYNGSKGNWRLVRSMMCTIGQPGMETPSGVFYVGSKPYYFNSGDVRCFYATQIWGDYLFHSILYNQRSTIPQPQNIADGRLGKNLSHGCVRLETGNAKWLQSTVPAGSTIVIY